jgi:hypothetical protein
MRLKDKKNEERRFWAASLILAGMCANYSNSPRPSIYWAYDAIEMADYLLHFLETQTPPVFNNVKDKDKGSKSL